jgi:transcriptional regulator with XRE-family HTH domain
MSSLHKDRVYLNTEIVKKLMEDKGLKISYIATALGVAERTVNGWINNRNRTPISAVRLLALKLQVAPETLIERFESKVREKYFALQEKREERAIMDSIYQEHEQKVVDLASRTDRKYWEVMMAACGKKVSHSDFIDIVTEHRAAAEKDEIESERFNTLYSLIDARRQKRTQQRV